MEKGLIYWYHKQFHKHPFVFVKMIDEERFIGCMITSAVYSEEYPQNIEMEPEHFSADRRYKKAYKPVLYKNSNLVRLFLIKKSSEVVDLPCGSLTKEGIEYLESKIENKEPVDWGSKEDWPEFRYENPTSK